MLGKEKPTHVYVSLDSLMDTRLGLLTCLSTDFAFEVSMDERYYNRQEDVFSTEKHGTLSKQRYAEAFAAAMDQVVRNSIRTRMFEFIEELMSKLFFEILSKPFHSSVGLEINTWPYVLNDEEATAIMDSVVTLFEGRFNVSLITRDPKTITAPMAAERYRAMVMYSYDEWLNTHNDDIQKKVLFDQTGLYVPTLYQGYIPTSNELAEFAKNNTNPFAMLTKVLSPFVTIQYLPVALYCAAIPANKPEFAAL